MNITNLSSQVRLFFVKDMDLHMSVVKDPYFVHYINLFDPLFETKKKLGMLLSAVEICGSEQEFLERGSDIRKQVIRHIEAKSEYEDFRTFQMDAQLKSAPRCPADNIYTPDNDGSVFVCIDMEEANFNAMRHFNESLVDGYTNYTDFLRQFTDIEYFLYSKRIRQVIFGQLSPKRQQVIQRYIMSQVFAYLMATEVEAEDVVSVSSDEIIVRNVAYESINDLMENRPCIKGIPFHVDEFCLAKRGNENFSFYVRYYLDGNSDIKCVPAAYMPEVVRNLRGEKPTDLDMVFYHDGRLCKFEEPLFKEE